MNILNITVFCAGVVMSTLGFMGISKSVDQIFEDIRDTYDVIDTDLEKKEHNKKFLFASYVALIILFFVIFVLGAHACIHVVSEL